jgi:hypothetical protein
MKREDCKYWIVVKYNDDREPYRNWSSFDTLCHEWPAAKLAIPEHFEFFRVNLINDALKIEIDADMNPNHYDHIDKNALTIEDAKRIYNAIPFKEVAEEASAEMARRRALDEPDHTIPPDTCRVCGEELLDDISHECEDPCPGIGFEEAEDRRDALAREAAGH